MKRFPVMTVALVTLSGVSVTFAAATYKVDTTHTNVGFTVRHLVINKVRGKFNEFSGTILYDEKDITKSSLQGTIQVGSIDTDHPKRDKHLRSPDFFDVENHKEITFASTRVEKEGDGYVLVGNLTMRGTSKEIRVPFEITGKIIDPQKRTVIDFEAALRINRQDFGLSYSRCFSALSALGGEWTDRPVISSATAMMWNALRLAGVGQTTEGYGRLLSMS